MIERFAPLFSLYMLEVNQTDPDTKTVVEGQELTVADARLYWHLFNGHKILVALEETGRPVGFLIYEMPYNGLMVARVMFILPAYRGRLFRSFVAAAASIKTKRIVFQTSKANPPVRMLEITQDDRKTFSARRQLGESDDMITWEMELKWQ